MRSNTKRMLTAVPLAAACGLMAGCYSSGLSMREGGSGMQGNYLVAMTSDLAGPMAERARFRGPATLAVAQIGEVSPPQGMLDELRKHGDVFARVHSIPATGLGQDRYSTNSYYDANDRLNDADRARQNINGVRNLARASGADYLLLVGGSVDQNDRATPLSAANLTIIGAFVVPSHKTEAVMKASGAVIDVRTGQLVSLSSAELKRDRLSTWATSDGEATEMLMAMRDRITVDLAKNVANDVASAR